jgi:hypothetical protein
MALCFIHGILGHLGELVSMLHAYKQQAAKFAITMARKELLQKRGKYFFLAARTLYRYNLGSKQF